MCTTVVLVLSVLLGRCSIGTTYRSSLKYSNEEEFESRIIGGGNAERHQFPYIVSIQYLGVHNCGGSILSKTWVVTAAHCCDTEVSPVLNCLKHKVVAGMLHLDEKHGDIQNVSVARVLIHPNYDGDPKYSNDIALLKLSPALRFTNAVKPINLPSIKKEFVEGWVAGWGIYMRPFLRPATLQCMKMQIIDNSVCQLLLDPVKIEVTLRDTEICTMPSTGLETTCDRDSGGPLLYNNTLIGITTRGPECKEYRLGDPSVFTRVSKYIGFIKNNVKDLPI